MRRLVVVAVTGLLLGARATAGAATGAGRGVKYPAAALPRPRLRRAGPARRSTEVPRVATGASAQRLETGVNGYLDTRFTGQRVRTDALLPADDVPALANLTEGNFQLKLRWGGRRWRWRTPRSSSSGRAFYRGPEHDVAAYHPLAVISELYGSYNFSDRVNVTLGKKRVVWGPGFFSTRWIC